jgi:malate dehydrogenase
MFPGVPGEKEQIMPVGKRFTVACIGAGNVGATVAQYCLDMELGDVVLADVVEGLPQGKALDMTQAGPVRGYSCVAYGTNNFAEIAGSSVVVVTAGLARKPGMDRLDLVQKNAEIMTQVCGYIGQYAPESVVIIVTNPLDVMSYLALKKLGFPPRRVVGMAGILDCARLRSFVATELGVSMKNVDTMLLGSHGNEMVPLPRYTTVSGVPITQLMAPDRIEALIDRTRKGGGEIVSLLKTGSAYYAPGASVARMVQCILQDERQIVPCSAYLTGQYGERDVYIGVPVRLGKGGIEEILEIELTDEERAAFAKSVGEVRGGVQELKQLNML